MLAGPVTKYGLSPYCTMPLFPSCRSGSELGGVTSSRRFCGKVPSGESDYAIRVEVSVELVPAASARRQKDGEGRYAVH